MCICGTELIQMVSHSWSLFAMTSELAEQLLRVVNGVCTVRTLMTVFTLREIQSISM